MKSDSFRISCYEADLFLIGRSAWTQVPAASRSVINVCKTINAFPDVDAINQ